MSGFATTIKLGRPRNELSFTVEMPENWNLDHNRVQAQAENAAGEKFIRILRRSRPNITFTIQAATEALLQKLESMQYIVDQPLSLYWANARNIYSDRYTLDTTTSLTLKSTPMTLLGADYVAAGGTNSDIIVPVGVFTIYDPAGAQGGTNYYTGGSYNATTRVITLGSSPGAAGTVVYVNWQYNGQRVYLNKISTKHSGGNVDANGPLWDVQIVLEGA